MVVYVMVYPPWMSRFWLLLPTLNKVGRGRPGLFTTAVEASAGAVVAGKDLDSLFLQGGGKIRP